MPDTEQEQGQNRVIDLKAGAHIMMLDAGVFCVFYAPGQTLPNDSGLPGVRITRAPGISTDMVEVSTFDADGWMSSKDGAALVRVHQGPAGVMVTTYQEMGSAQPGPRLQVMRLIGGSTSQEEQTPQEKSSQADTPSDDSRPTSSDKSVVTAHIQRYGDVSGGLGEWIGTPGSHLWIEGFSVNVTGPLKADDIEYQAVLGRGWLSPWIDGGDFCGSRGMSLPILGFRARLKGEAASRWTLQMSAAFTDGTRLGPVDGLEEALEAQSLAPLEGFCLELLEKKDRSSSGTEKSKKTAQRRTSSSTRKSEKRRARS